MRFCLALLFLFIFSSIFPLNSHAAPKFAVSHDVTYKILESGNTKVTQNVHIKNLTTEALAKEIVFKIKNYRVFNIQAFDASGALDVNSYEIPEGVEARVQFGKLTPGVDKVHHWTLTFETPSLAKKVGRLWKVSLPPITKTSREDQATVSLQVPESFGKLVQAKPTPQDGNSFWSGTNASGQLIAVYAENDNEAYQAYDFKLRYFLENKDLTTKAMIIALPPDTNYQKVFLTDINPKPTNIRLDLDGNWLAEYILKGKEETAITASGSIAVFGSPKFDSPNQIDHSLYLQSLPNWETNHPEIRKAAQTLKSPSDVYSYTVSHLSYDKNKAIKNPTRLGAAKALTLPLSAICTEFTDVFIALSRTLGIPAREVDGFAYTEDQVAFPSVLGKDVLHAWPEYYDPIKKVWTMVDPTWGNTSGGLDYFSSFDFDHVALAIRGVDSQKPDPAGFYKKTTKLKKFISEEKPQKDVFIAPVDKNLEVERTAQLEITTKDKPYLAGLPTRSVAVIKNPNNFASSKAQIAIGNKTVIVPKIPPFGWVTVPITPDSDKIIPFGSLTWFTSLPEYFL